MEGLSSTRKFPKEEGATRENPWLREGGIRELRELTYKNYREHVEEMNNEVAGLRDKLQRTSQEAKEKLRQEKPASSGSGASHK